MPPKQSVAAANRTANNNNNNNNSQKPGILPVALDKPAKSPILLKLCVRRLPPGLTQDEFLDSIGPEWNPSAGKVDWFQYRSGKTSTTAKIAEQSRAYLHLTSPQLIKQFEANFFNITFIDAKGTHRDPNLKHYPPFLEYAPNQRIPAAKHRQDGRQGTIDQDPEFIAFLESETQPVVKPMSLDAAIADKPPQEKCTSTPLLDDLREKKANKSKAAPSKSTKSARSDQKEDKPTSRRGDAESKQSKSASKPADPVKAAVKIATKQASKNGAAAAAAASASAAPATASVSKTEQQPPASPASGRKQRERVTPSTIKSMLQRDLGIAAPSAGKRGPKAAAAAANPTVAASEAASATSHSRSATPVSSEAAQNQPKPEIPVKSKSSRSRKANAADKTNGQPPAQDATKPPAPAPAAILKKTSAAQSTAKGAKTKANPQPATSQNPASPIPSQSPAPSRSTKAAPSPSSGATKAYLKHANASQGITEPLILAALSSIGQVVKVDIDKRKGTALAEFKDPESLKAAMAKRSIPIAQGAVEILEFRERPGQGGSNAGAGGRAANPSAAAARNGGGSVRGKAKSGRGAAVANGAPATAVAASSDAP